jgi:hypothetical protein
MDKSLKILVTIALVLAIIIMSWFILNISSSCFATLSPTPTPIIKTGKAIMIQSIAWDDNIDKIRVYVQNVGASEVTLSSVYVNGELDNSATISPKDLSPAVTSEITLSETYASRPTQITVKIVAVDGTSSQVTKTFP